MRFYYLYYFSFLYSAYRFDWHSWWGGPGGWSQPVMAQECFMVTLFCLADIATWSLSFIFFRELIYNQGWKVVLRVPCTPLEPRSSRTLGMHDHSATGWRFVEPNSWSKRASHSWFRNESIYRITTMDGPHWYYTELSSVLGLVSYDIVPMHTWDHILTGVNVEHQEDNW